ncbi:hypothetical protein DYB34_004091 [Aphanomyces astaci]|uniref:ubiquitinyl hydrolase 1 n=1 Tax=Aphanomyces astaci TaxID=112090 RepID=A0A3R6VTX0_APHAT|nr:hypothetical protein DYB34_004091 [Aphanomyces astaci]
MDTTCTMIAEELSSMADPSDYLAAILEVVSSSTVEGDALDRLIADYMPHFVRVVLARSFGDDCAPHVNEFLQVTLECVIQRLREGDPSMIPTMHRIFDPRRQFYTSRLTAKSSSTNETYDYAASASALVHADVLRNINFFGDQGGFHVLLCNIDVHMALDESSPTSADNNHDEHDDNNRVSDSFSLDALVCALNAVAVAVDLFTDAFAVRFLDDLTTALCHYVRRTPVPRESVRELDELVTLLAVRVDKSTEAPRRSSVVLVNEFRLEMALQGFRGRTLERRINGLTDLNDALKNLSAVAGTPTWTRRHVVAWLDTNMVLDDLLGEAMHPELVKRGGTVFEFYIHQALLLPSHVTRLWAVCIDTRRHATTLAAVHELYLDVVTHVAHQPPMIDHVFGLLDEVSQLEAHALATLRVLATSGQLTRVVSWLWSAMKANKCSGDHDVEAALALLDELIVQDGTLLSQLLVDCVQTVEGRGQGHDAALWFLSQLSRLMSEGHKIELLAEHRHHVNVSFLCTLLDDLTAYKQQSPKGNHADQIKRRLLALHGSWTLASSSGAYTLTTNHLDLLWGHCVTHATSPDESSLFFQWIRLCETLVPQSHGQVVLLSLPLQRHLLTKFQSLDGTFVTQDALECFQLLFGKVNAAQNFLDDSHVVCAPLQSLEGLSQLWHLAVHASDVTVAEDTISTLVGYHLDVVPSLLDASKQMFVDTAIDFFLAAKSAQGVGNHVLRANRCIDLLRFFLEACGDKAGTDEAELTVLPSPMKYAGGSVPPPLSPSKVKRANLQWPPPLSPTTTQGPDQRDTDVAAILMEFQPAPEQVQNDRTSSLQRIDTQRPARVHPLSSEQMALAIQASGDRCIGGPPPSEAYGTMQATVVNHPHFFDALFSILDWPGVTSERAWELLCRLPSNRALLQHMVVLRDSRTSKVPWQSLLDTSNIPRLLYGLRLVEALLKPLTAECESHKHTPRRQWRERFIRLGGGLHLYTALLHWSHTPLTSPETGFAQDLHSTCLALLATTLQYFITLDSTQLASSPYDLALRESTLPAFIAQLSLHKIAAQAVTMVRTSPEANAVVVVAATRLLFATVSTEDVVQWTDADLKELVLDLSVRHPSIRADLCAQLVLFVVSHADVHTNISRVTCDLVVCGTVANATNELPELLVALLSHGIAPTLKSWMHDSRFGQRFLSHVTSHRSTDTWSATDHTLAAYLGVLKLLVHAKVCPVADAVELLLDTCLFGTNTSSNSVLCKSSATRAVASDLVVELAATASVWASSLAPRVSRFHDQVRDVLDTLGRPWNLTPRDEARDGVTAAGLYNPGCICYMNALLQQLFHVPSFRECILATAVDPAESSAAEEVAELQAVFVSLIHTTRKWHDPSAFGVSHRDVDGQPTDLRVQMDADEFLGMLLDRVESVLLTKPASKMTIGTLGFGGQLVNQIITEHGHVSEREEPFVVLSLDVQHKPSIEASLGSYVQGETLEGDNAYFCEVVKEKVRATKRVCIKTLPETLVVHLKRFEFDYDTMEKVKLNDFVEFPTQLNMAPFTAEGLQRGPGHDEAWYALKGVVVHSGTADMGHYYSFIQDRAESTDWWEFNDQIVRPFSLDNLTDECFGGDEVVDKWDPTTRAYASVLQPKKRSAYMLVYDRVSKTPVESPPLPMSSTALALQASVQVENDHFDRLLHAMDGAHIRFLRSLWPQAPAEHQPPLLRAIMDLASLLPAGSTVVPALDVHSAAASMGSWFLHQATEVIMPHESAPVVIGDYAHRRTWLFDMTFLCHEPSVRHAFWDLALASVRHVIATDADVVATFLDHIVTLFFQRDSIEVSASCMSTVVSNAALGAALQPVAAFLEATTDGDRAVDIAHVLVERCHVLHHFGASFTVDDCPEGYMQPTARVATFPIEQRFLTRLVEAGPRVPSVDVDSFVARTACILSCGFEKLMATVVAHVVEDDADVSLTVIRALLEVLDQVKTTHLEAMFDVFNALLGVADAHSSLRAAALLSPESGLLEVAEFFKLHRTLHQYTYYVLEFCLTSEVPAVVEYLNDVKDQVPWVRPWMWSYLRGDVPVGDLTAGDDDTDVQTVLELTEQLFGQLGGNDQDDEEGPNQEDNKTVELKGKHGAMSVGKLVDSSEGILHSNNPAEVET